MWVEELSAVAMGVPFLDARVQHRLSKAWIFFGQRPYGPIDVQIQMPVFPLVA